MTSYNICFLGFGNVGRALARLLAVKASELRGLYETECQITGIATRKRGWWAYPEGIDASNLTSRELPTEQMTRCQGLEEWLKTAQPDAVFETTSLDHQTGQPAIDYLTAILRAGAHALTANKGAVVYGYEQLSQLAQSVGKQFYFESTVLDSAPVFSLFRETLPAVKLRGFSGILNSTTNVIIETMEEGRTLSEGIRTAQELGVAETDPAHDIDGWDATVKVCALAKVLMKSSLRPHEVLRAGVRELTPQRLQAARSEGKPFKLVARAHWGDDGSLTASVKPEQISLSDPLGSIRGTSLALHFELDMMPGLTIISHRPNLQSTAYGLLADFINAVRKEKPAAD